MGARSAEMPRGAGRETAARKARLEEIPGGAATALGMDRLIHERARLAIVSALAVQESQTFADLKHALGLTDGNLSVHARKLEDAGYIECVKGFDGRIPRTVFRLTAKGRRALARYVDHMEALVRAMRKA
jgi:DNA-binding MarR family transcriptional regulator